MLTIRGRLITPFILGFMSVGLNILIRHSFTDLWVWIMAWVPWQQLLYTLFIYFYEKWNIRAYKRNSFSYTKQSFWIERKATIRNRYNYLSSVQDTKGKEGRTKNNGATIKTLQAESPKDSFFPKHRPNGYPKEKKNHHARHTCKDIQWQK